MRKTTRNLWILLAMIFIFSLPSQARAQEERVRYVHDREMEEEFIKLWDDYRLEKGQKKIIRHPLAERIGDLRIKEVSDDFTHTSKGGYRYNSENIAAGYPSPKAVLQGWINSPGHHSNLLLDNMWGAHTAKCMRKEYLDENGRVISSRISWLTLSAGRLDMAGYKDESFPAKIREVEDPDLDYGKTQVESEGREGTRRTYLVSMLHNFDLDNNNYGNIYYKDYIETDAFDRILDAGEEKVVRVGVKNKPQIKKYISKGVNLRDEDGKKIGYLKSNQVFEGELKGKQVELTFEGKQVRVDERFTSAYGREAYFVSKGVNVRNKNGEKIGKLLSGARVLAKDYGAYVEIDYRGEKAQVYKNFVEEDGISRTYKSLGVNVRDRAGEKIGYLNKGEKIKGKRDGALIRINYKGQEASIHSKFLN